MVVFIQNGDRCTEYQVIHGGKLAARGLASVDGRVRLMPRRVPEGGVIEILHADLGKLSTLQYFEGHDVDLDGRSLRHKANQAAAEADEAWRSQLSPVMTTHQAGRGGRHPKRVAVTVEP